MRYTAIIFICFLAILYTNLCIASNNPIELREINWNINKNDTMKDKKIINSDKNTVTIIENIYGRDTIVTYIFNDGGNLVSIEETFNKFESIGECIDFENKILDLILKKYNKVNSLEDMYSYCKDNNTIYDMLIINGRLQEWEKLFNDDKINILYKCRDNNIKENGVITIRYEKKNWIDKEENNNGWYVEEKKSKLDGKNDIYVSKKSIDSLPNSLGRPEKGQLTLRCVDDETEVYIVWPNFIGINENQVKYKIDNNKINTEIWTLSTDGEAVFVSKPIKFLNSLKGTKRLIIQLDSYKQGKGELEFNLAGIDDYIDQVAKCCHWYKKK